MTRIVSLGSVPSTPSPSLGVPAEGGKGADLIQKFMALATTLFQLLRGIGDRSDVMGNRGKQLRNVEVKSYIGNLKADTKNFDFIPDQVEGKTTISDVEALSTKVKNTLRDQRPPKPVLIPIVIGSDLPLEFQHIVAMVIDPVTRRVEYFDAQGVTAENKQLDSAHTMKDFIEAVVKNIGWDNAVLIENVVIHQKDIHSCGAFVAAYAQERFGQAKNPEDIMDTRIRSNEIVAIRQKMQQQKYTL